MKIAFVSTYDRIGGAAQSCWRTADALRAAGVETTLVVQKARTDASFVVETNSGPNKLIAKSREYFERLIFANQESSKEVRFYFSLDTIGQDISKIPAIQSADIIHLHWIHKGYLSLKNLEQLAQLGKPIVWSLHDMWAFTGGCHYAGSCTHFEKQCGNCWYLKNPGDNDLSHQIWSRKKAFFNNKKWKIVTSSKWLGETARRSSMFSNFDVQAIPTPVETDIFKPLDKNTIRQKLNLPTDKKLLLFVAMNIAEKRKGFTYLEKALLEIPEDTRSEYELIVMGKAKAEQLNHLPFKTHYLGLLSDPHQIAEAYNASDCYLMPSLEDNLPNTILESLSCGVPVVAFGIGGIPEMVVHQQNGYIATKENHHQLREGIEWIFSNQVSYSDLCKNSRQQIEQYYSYEAISKQYITLYKNLVPVS